VSELRDRLVLALVDALTEGDPVLTVAVGDRELTLRWDGAPGE
jgi:hypothetical protein